MMKKILPAIILTALFIVSTFHINAQVCEWRLVNPVFNSTDPDGVGPAKGSITFVFQVHTSSGTIANVTGLSCGWSYQSSSAMIPTTPGCTPVNTPANVSISPGIFTTGGYAYNNVNQCNNFTQTVGGQTFDRTSAGSLEGSGITLTTTWTDVYTVTLWTLGNINPQGGYLIINSGSTGSPNPLGSYAISDASFNDYTVNSLTATTPLAAGGLLPVTYATFSATCNDKGALINWTTGNELNADYFELQRSKDGTEWSTVSKIKAKGNSTIETNYQIIDVLGGTSLYRLQQYDLNGNFNYSSITKTSCDNRSREISIYPVPANDILHVVIKTDKTLKIPLEIYDALGRLIKTINYNVIAGSNNIAISLAGLANGQFVIRSTEPTFYLNKKFTIVH